VLLSAPAIRVFSHYVSTGLVS